MDGTNPPYIYTFLRRDTDQVQFDIFTRQLNENDVNMYVEYICEDEFTFLPETLRIIHDAGNSIVVDKTQDILHKILTVMHMIGECDECPILMYHGTVEEFLRFFSWYDYKVCLHILQPRFISKYLRDMFLWTYAI